MKKFPVKGSDFLFKIPSFISYTVVENHAVSGEILGSKEIFPRSEKLYPTLDCAVVVVVVVVMVAWGGVRGVMGTGGVGGR